jgi:hypothetical protein
MVTSARLVQHLVSFFDRPDLAEEETELAMRAIALVTSPEPIATVPAREKRPRIRMYDEFEAQQRRAREGKST